MALTDVTVAAVLDSASVRHVLALWLALLVDRVLGEPLRWHPLVGFGRLTAWLERRLNRHAPGRADGGGMPAAGAADVPARPPADIARGVLAWSLLILPPVAVTAWLASLDERLALLLEVVLLYVAIGAQSLREHAEAILRPLASGDLQEARRRVGYIVSRDTAALDEEGVARAACESVLENGNDAIFGAVFWFLLLGAPGAVLFRLANTLDAMWGYRTPRFNHFGRWAARSDDVLNLLPARLTALTYALCGQTVRALRCWRAQAVSWDSPNAGPVMAAGAGALGVRLGGVARYHGQDEARPVLGEGVPPDRHSLQAAIHLVQRGAMVWMLVAALSVLF